MRYPLSKMVGLSLYSLKFQVITGTQNASRHGVGSPDNYPHVDGLVLVRLACGGTN